MQKTEKEALQILAHLYMQHEKDDKARVLLEAVQELFPEDTYAARSLAWIYLKEERHADALEQIALWERYETAPTTEERRVTALLKSGALNGMGRTDEARTALDIYLQETGETLPTEA